VRTVRNQVAIGSVAQGIVLAALGWSVGLTPLGWIVGVGTAVAMTLFIGRALVRSGRSALGPANQVTWARGTLVCAVAGLVADGFVRTERVGAIVVLSAVALMLDNVDGRVARRAGVASSLGARFDMEVDAFLILVLSVDVSASLGAWVLAIGAMRYTLAAAEVVTPWLRAPVPVRYWRKVVAAVQGVVLAVAASHLLPRTAAAVTVAVALALLAESFGRDVWWLSRQTVRTQRESGHRRIAAGAA
jgi:phosphatidylglycerophosphate synthase